jgi:hypothetical protein
MTADTDRTRRVIGGCLAIAAGLGVCALVWSQPQQLHAPAWVVYTAGLAFVLAGLALLVRFGSRLNFLLSALTALALFVPGAWVAFGSGPRECSFSLPFMHDLAPAVACRVAFGVGAALIALVFILLLTRAYRSHSAG